ncbi:zinc-binding alcohol dehydrogenase family protein [Streptomyces sp. NPDC099088]|uniref:quinone oxidoreductase family protein n=1 Tax=Streptomyces sp. NPDC099088 TaxID=3366101 RepID=UPI00382A0172
MSSTRSHDATDAHGEIRAAVVDAPGASPRVSSVTLPPRTPGSTLMAVVAAPVNPLDLVIASGTFHSARHEAPYVPGSECVGVVLASDRYQPGSWVYAECHASPDTPGSLATQVLVDDKNVLALPEGIDPVQAAAVGNSGTAAFMPLVEEAGLRSGETVLVLGATGAVGQLAIQVAHRRGAGRVVGGARDRSALERLPALGADAIVDLRAEESAEALAERLRAAAGPVDVVLDGVYGMPLEAALQVCAPRAADRQRRQSGRRDRAPTRRAAARKAAHPLRLRRSAHPAAGQGGGAHLAVDLPRTRRTAGRRAHLPSRRPAVGVAGAGGLAPCQMRCRASGQRPPQTHRHHPDPTRSEHTSVTHRTQIHTRETHA